MLAGVNGLLLVFMAADAKNYFAHHDGGGRGVVLAVLLVGGGLAAGLVGGEHRQGSPRPWSAAETASRCARRTGRLFGAVLRGWLSRRDALRCVLDSPDRAARSRSRAAYTVTFMDKNVTGGAVVITTVRSCFHGDVHDGSLISLRLGVVRRWV